jgi:hypothetical protein
MNCHLSFDSDIQIPYPQRIALNKRPPRLNLVTHQGGEDGIFDAHFSSGGPR